MSETSSPVESTAEGVRERRFRILALSSLVYTTGVILWGAFVRVTGSGAGCGQHWPTCHGEVVPRSQTIETLIEFTHRWTSGVCMLLVLATLVFATRVFPRGHRVRLGAWLSFGFVITEALVGAGLVLLEYVADDSSVARAFWMAGHLVNTYLLTAAMLMTWWWARDNEPRPNDPDATATSGRERRAFFIIAAIGLFVVSMTGAITALGDTVFPIEDGASFVDRVTGGGVAHYLVRLRIVHPILASGLGLYLIVAPWNVATRRERRFALWLSVGAACQVMFGVANIALGAPAIMQLGHLLLALAVWLALVRFAAEALARR